MQWVTTTVVLENLRRSDEAAWQQFVERFRQPIVRFARGLGLTEDEAEDVTQETLMDFVRAYRQGQYDPEKGRLSAWLFGIAHRRVLHAFRRRAGQPHPAPAQGQSAFCRDVPDERTVRQSWDASWQRSVLHQCLEQVRIEVEPNTLRAFEMLAINRRPATDVADTLGMTRNAVFIAKHRVLKRVLELKRQFEEVA